MKKYKENIISAIISGLLTIFIWHNFLVSGNNIIFIFIFITSYFIIKNTINQTNKRRIVIVSIISFIIAIIEVLCKSINIDYTLNHVINKWLVINLVGYFTISWIIIQWIYNLFETNKLETNSIENTNIKIFGKDISKIKILNNETFIFIMTVILIFIAWCPYFLRYYPGIVTSDSYSQIEMTIGKIPLSDHHPIAHTAIIGIFINLGLLIFKNINTGIALYSIASMIIMAILDTCVLRYLKEKKVPRFIRIIILLYYMFYPVNAMYSITMWKDVLFSGIVPIFVILCTELIFHTESFLKKKRNVFIYILISLLTIYLRHNGFYAVILTLPFILIVLRKYWKQILPMFGGIIAFYIILNVFIFNIMKVEKGSIGEMLSVPMQQIARVEKNHREELPDEITEKINQFFRVENIGDKYNPILSDPVKSNFNAEEFDNNKGDFIGLWLKLLVRNPKDYVEAFISNSYGYYYPEAINSAVSRVTMDHNMGIKQEPKIKGTLVEKIDELTDKRDIPIISMMFSIGSGFLLTVICLGYVIEKKEYKYILAYLPIFILWLTMIASPAFCEFRYAYPIFTTLPVFISVNFIKRKELKDGKNSSSNTML